MSSDEELRASAEINLQAVGGADHGGARPKQKPLMAGVVTAVGAFILLDVFAAVMLPDRETALWPIIVLTIICSGGAAAIQWRRERAWLDRYAKAANTIRATKR